MTSVGPSSDIALNLSALLISRTSCKQSEVEPTKQRRSGAGGDGGDGDGAEDGGRREVGDRHRNGGNVIVAFDRSGSSGFKQMAVCCTCRALAMGGSSSVAQTSAHPAITRSSFLTNLGQQGTRPFQPSLPHKKSCSFLPKQPTRPPPQPSSTTTTSITTLPCRQPSPSPLTFVVVTLWAVTFLFAWTCPL